MNLSRLAHQMLIVDAFGTLACSHVGQHLGQAAMDAYVNESGTRGVVFGTANRNGCRVALRVVVEGAVGYAAVGDVSCHGEILRGSARPDGRLADHHVRPVRPNQKDPIV
jgi:hypothetical protein